MDMRKQLLLLLGVVLLGNSARAAEAETQAKQSPPCTVAIYYWPNFHRDPFHQSKKGEGWTEWEIVKAAKARFPGHEQPKEPLWGYRDESDPKQMARSIDAMADAGIGAIIFDWYRYDDGLTGNKMIEAALERGFLGAPNRNRIRFALMWANENYVDCHPFAPGKSFGNAPLWRKGTVGRAAFDRHTQDVISRYFSQPNYWKIDGKPYFSIYELPTLIRGLGGLEATHAALKAFRDRVKAAGFPDLHLNVVDRGLGGLARGEAFPGNPTRKIASEADLLAALGVDSTTMYTWAHHVRAAPAEPVKPEAGRPASAEESVRIAAAKSGATAVDYLEYGERAMKVIDARSRSAGVTYFPHVSVGWDGTPRNYPPEIVVNTTPERFGQFLARAKSWLDAHPESKGIITINSWNEWVEGSYIEPDKKHGTAYLDQIRAVFGKL